MTLFVSLTTLLGCQQGGGPDRVSISGSVTYEGAPVEGAISMRPAAGTTGPAAGGEIRDGRYLIPKDRGPAPGNYDATIMIVAEEVANQGRGCGNRGFRKTPRMRRVERKLEISEARQTHEFVLP